MQNFSQLDLSSTPDGKSAAEALDNRAALAQFRNPIDRYQQDGLMVSVMIHDHCARLASFQIALGSWRTSKGDTFV